MRADTGRKRACPQENGDSRGMQRGPRPLAKRVFVNKNTSCYATRMPATGPRTHRAAMYKCALPLFRLTPSPVWTAVLPSRPFRARPGFAETQKCALPTARVSGVVFRGCPEPLGITGQFPECRHHARAFPPRAPPGYLFSGDAVLGLGGGTGWEPDGRRW